MPSKKTTRAARPIQTSSAKPATGKASMSKTAFVKAQPVTMKAKDVVAKAKASGLSLTEKYIYSIRYEHKKAGKKTQGRVKVSSTQPAIKTARTLRSGNGNGTHGIEDLLRAAAAELGLSRAIALLQDQQNSVRAVLGG